MIENSSVNRVSISEFVQSTLDIHVCTVFNKKSILVICRTAIEVHNTTISTAGMTSQIYNVIVCKNYNSIMPEDLQPNTTRYAP